MKKFQNTYEVSAVDDDIRSTPLSIHAHTGTVNNRLIVFVHGLNGERYETWGKLPDAFFKRFIDADMGFYGYTNGMKRWNPFQSLSVEDEAQVLVDTLRDSPYQEIVLMGHSLGGVLLRTAVSKMVEMNQIDLLTRLKAMFLFAVPQQGAHSLPRFISILNSDASALSRNSPSIKRTTRIFLDHFQTDKKINLNSEKHWLPVYCLQAAKDMWVKELSAALNIPSHMRKVIRDSHTGLVKGDSEEVIKWLVERTELYFETKTTIAEKNSKMIRHGPKTDE